MNSNSKCNAAAPKGFGYVVVDRLRQTFHFSHSGVCHAVSARDVRRTVDDRPDVDFGLVHPLHCGPPASSVANFGGTMIEPEPTAATGPIALCRAGAVLFGGHV